MSGSMLAAAGQRRAGRTPRSVPLCCRHSVRSHGAVQESLPRGATHHTKARCTREAGGIKWLQTPEQERLTKEQAAEGTGVSKQLFRYHYNQLAQCGQAQLLAHRLVSEGAAPVQTNGKKCGLQPKVDTGYNG